MYLVYYIITFTIFPPSNIGSASLPQLTQLFFSIFLFLCNLIVRKKDPLMLDW